MSAAPNDTTGRETVRELRRRRPKCCFVRTSAWLAVLGTAAVWFSGGFRFGELFSARRWTNVRRFATEATPYPLRDGDPTTGLGDWIGQVVVAQGVPAATTTLFISIAGVLLAGFGAIALAPLAARNVATGSPFTGATRHPNGSLTDRHPRWEILRSTIRGLFVLARSIPEYILAFLFLALLGGARVALVLALAVHNLGSSGGSARKRLKTCPTGRSPTTGASGLDRKKTTAFVALPGAASRFLVYFFYRWETCLRDATVLGMLGLVSLGFLIEEARARLRYDEMLAFVLISVVLVGIGDLASIAARRMASR